MARPMQRIGTGSLKEDIVAKLMRMAFLIGFAVTGRRGRIVFVEHLLGFHKPRKRRFRSRGHPMRRWIPGTILTTRIPAGTTPKLY